jgi:antitoxin (DNA-binding transcriptional repressor) of toxin-antitoxin stability system
MTHVDIKQAGEEFTDLMELVAKGYEIIIEKDKEPFAKLIPLKRTMGKRQFGSAKGMIIMADDFDDPLEDFQEYM